jgi:hypothetical protein
VAGGADEASAVRTATGLDDGEPATHAVSSEAERDREMDST